MAGARRERALARPSASLALALVVFVGACDGSSSSPTAPTTSRPSVVYLFPTASVNPAVLAVGDTGVASVWAWTTSNGTPIYGPIPVTRWTSSSTAVATVTNSGSVAAVAPGTATLTATFDGGTQVATAGVFGPRDIEAVEVACFSPVALKQVTTCQAQVRTRYGNAPVRAAWTSSNPDVASLVGSPAAASTAFLNANAPGQTVVSATYGVFRGEATVEVRN
jgi:hypothetical protein